MKRFLISVLSALIVTSMLLPSVFLFAAGAEDNGTTNTEAEENVDNYKSDTMKDLEFAEADNQKNVSS